MNTLIEVYMKNMIFAAKHIKKIFPLVFFFLSSGSFSHEKTVTLNEILPEKKVLLKSLSRYYTKLEGYYIADLKNRRKGLLFHLLPVLGFDFISGAPTFLLNSQSFKKDLARFSSQEGIILTLRLKLHDDKLEIEHLYSLLANQVEVYNQMVTSFSYLSQVEKVKTGLYERLEISPTEYLLFMRDYENKKTSLLESFYDLLKRAEELKKLSRLKSDNL